MKKFLSNTSNQNIFVAQHFSCTHLFQHHTIPVSTHKAKLDGGVCILSWFEIKIGVIIKCEKIFYHRASEHEIQRILNGNSIAQRALDSVNPAKMPLIRVSVYNRRKKLKKTLRYIPFVNNKLWWCHWCQHIDYVISAKSNETVFG